MQEDKITIKEGYNNILNKRSAFEMKLVEKYPVMVYLVQIAVILILAWTCWELTRQDYKPRAICSFFYEKQEQIGECKQPVFLCGDVEKSPLYTAFQNLTKVNSSVGKPLGPIPQPGYTPTGGSG